MTHLLIRSGIDMIEISRVERAIQRSGERFLARIYTQNELTDCSGNVASLAARFAAKEAVSKALGEGIGSIAWRDIEIRRAQHGEPLLFLHGSAAQKAADLGLQSWSLSLSHSYSLAIAMVVAT